jgi:hypothetical protein
MKPETKVNLTHARSLFGDCAEKIVNRQPGGKHLLSADEMEMLIGLGAARDWIRWARALEDLNFSVRAERRSARAAGITESVRFNQMWTATNALFAKDSILKEMTAAALPFPELKRFELVYAFAKLDATTEAHCLKTIKDSLGMACRATGVTSVLGGSDPTMWEVIDQKYSRPADRQRGLGKVIKTALLAGTIPNPSGPELIYGTRNWAVHGMLLTSFFRGSRQKYITFIDSITLLLSCVLKGAAEELKAKL